MSTKQVRCKFHRQGVCTKGAACPFSHDANAQADNTCRFYLQGNCAYGAACRYDHVKPDKRARHVAKPAAAAAGAAARAPATAPTSAAQRAKPSTAAAASASASAAAPWVSSSAVAAALAAPASNNGRKVVLEKSTWKRGNQKQEVKPEWAGAAEFVPGAGAGSSTGSKRKADGVPYSAITSLGVKPADGRDSPSLAEIALEGGPLAEMMFGGADAYYEFMYRSLGMDQFEDEEEEDEDEEYAGHGYHGGRQREITADDPICPFAAARGECLVPNCQYVHGDMCPCCMRRVLHPKRPEENQKHIDQCVSELEGDLKHDAAAAASKGVECAICLEEVLRKANRSDRRFGLLQNCDHAFCLKCIREWRNTSELGKTIRTCPMCREPSFFVTPSDVFVKDPKEKAEVIDAYKAQMASMDCKHFNFGDGSCPFGGSCFYKHADKTGRIVDEKPRYRSNADGEAMPAAAVRLSDFFAARMAADEHLGGDADYSDEDEEEGEDEGRPSWVF